jgi:FkbM family methyltransferase
MKRSLSFYPVFSDQEALDDHYFRALWFLSPFKEQIQELIFPCAPELVPPRKVPEWLDPELAELAAGMPSRIQTTKDQAAVASLVSLADGVLLWSQGLAKDPLLNGKQVIRIDHQNVQYAASFYLKIHERFSEFQSHNLATVQRIFERIRQRCTSNVGYIFGTGPGLSQALEKGYDFSDGVCIACNSMVRNQALMERISPPLIAIADPIFHAGPSSYAAAFRKELIQALDKFNADLIVPMRDYHVYAHHLPDRFTSRIAAIPFSTDEVPNLNVSQHFHVTATGNILTLFLLPLAATFFKEIRIFGCDGRPMEANDYFWSHDTASQFNDRMDEIKRAHPAFFALDYDHYYSTHCDTLDKWLRVAEAAGKRIQNYTPSYIPALISRNVTGVAAAGQSAPSVSIVMPAFNAARFLPEAIRSIQDQSFTDWELLIVDDHSTDETRAIVIEQMRKDVRIRVLSTVGKGVSAARNTGVRNAQGRYIGFLDADDTMDTGSLAARVAALEAGGVSLVHGRMRLIDEAGNDLGAWAGARRDLTFKDMQGFHTHCNTVMGRRSVIKRMEFPEGVANGEDWWAFARLLRSGVRSHYVEAGSATYRMHPSSTVKKDMMGHIAALERVVDWVASDQEGHDIAPEFHKGLAEPPKSEILAPHFLRAIVCSVLSGRSDGLEDLLNKTELVQWLEKQTDSDLRRRVTNIAVHQFAKPASLLADMPSDVKRRIADSRSGVRVRLVMPRLFQMISDVIALNDEGSYAEFERCRHAYVDETAVVAEMLKHRTGRGHIMLDVGAHFGTSAAYYDELGWTIHCFEPDSRNRQRLLAKHGGKENFTFDNRGVGDNPRANVPFFRSEESTGISGLIAFRDSHRETGKIDLTTIAEVVETCRYPHVDFLKIDVEGFDFNVLKGVPWDRIKPDVIECEYEDAKTVPMGHTWRDIADFLREKGYAVYISEWHPIIRYGIAHDWRRVVAYPGTDVPSDSWGNILAFREDPGYIAIAAAFQKLVKTRSAAPIAAGPGESVAPSKAVNERPASSRPNDGDGAAPMLAVSAPPKRPFYAPVGDWLRVRSPRAFRLAQFARRALAGLWRRRVWTLPALLLLAALPFLALHPALAGHEALVLSVAGAAILAFAVFCLALWVYQFATRISAETAALRGALAGNTAEAKAARNALQAALTESLETRFGEVSAETAALRGELEKVARAAEASDAALKAEIQKASKAAASGDETLKAEVAARDEAVRADLAAVRDGIDQRLHAEIDERVEKFASTLKAAIDEQVAKTETAAEAKAARNALKAALTESLETRLGEVSTETAALRGELEKIAGAAEASDAALKAEIQKALKAAASGDETLKAEFDGARKDLGGVKDKLGALESRSVSLHLAVALRLMRPLWIGGSAVEALAHMPEVEHGHELMMAVLADEEQENPGVLAGKTLIEIGTTRENVPAQGSTQKLAVFTALTGMRFVTVDMDPANTKAAGGVLRYLNPAAQAVTARGESFLPAHPGPLEYVYLDAFDFDHPNHAEARRERYRKILGTDIADPACWKMHEDCAATLVARMDIGAVVVLDDTWTNEHGEYEGKGKLATPLLLASGFEIIARTKRTVALRRISKPQAKKAAPRRRAK